MTLPSPLRTAVLGAGAWGTALAGHLARAGHQVALWAYEPEVVQAVNREHRNPLFLPGFTLPAAVAAHGRMDQALAGAELVALTMPSHVFRAVLRQAAPALPLEALLVSCAKGIEADTGYTMCEVAADVLPKEQHRRLACLSGPSFAKEVAAGMPTAVTVASRQLATARQVQLAIATSGFRVYTSPDVTGVELGGAVKNPLAIAAGMVAGLGLGHNTLAALITRGLAEMMRLAGALGGQPQTLAGLSGLGDLVLTCTGELSRNRTVGFRLGKGESMEAILAGARTVAEGVRNTLTVRALAQRLGVEMPIVAAVHDVIYQGVAPNQALAGLMARELKAEY